MRKLASLTPEKVFNYFEDICNIPHGSTNTRKISDYCANFAKANNLEYNQDSLGNVVIKKPATEGYENSPSVILQGHMDMVCQKDTAISNIDMETQGLNIDINGDFIHANGTTLGGDDGISVAYILAILTDDTLQHPALEAVLTVDEEIGLLGATGMDMSQLKSKMMINIDTEEEGIFTTSCAGGVSANCNLPVTFENKTGTQVTVTVSGLLGGHSGVEIDKKRANGNKLMARFLNILSQKVDFGLVTLQGGTKDNAIPFLSTASIIFDEQDVGNVKETVKELDEAFKNEFKTSDKGVTLSITNIKENASCKATVLNDTKRIVSLLNIMPNGIQTMSADIDGLVESSLNLGVMMLSETALQTSSSVRSSVSSLKSEILNRLFDLVGTFGGTVKLVGDYPAWEYKKDSPLRDTMCEVYFDLFGKKARVEAIHAGLECGLFSGKIEGLDCNAFGPNMLDVHTSKEQLSISSVQRMWLLLTETLKKLK